jgi:hypothetical protein
MCFITTDTPPAPFKHRKNNMANLRLFNIWMLVNVPVIAIIIMGGINGNLSIIFNDITYITHAIFAFIILNVLYTGWTSWKIDKLKTDDYYKDQLYAKLNGYLRFPKFSTNFVITLGFLGTIVGVIIGFHHLPADAFTNAVKMQDFIRMMLVGFSVELNSLLMGVMGKVWLSVLVYVQSTKMHRIMASV